MTSGDALRRRLTEQTGIEFARGGLSDSLQNFVERRLEELSLDDEPAYLELVNGGASDETARLIDVISVPHTWFFRDPVQLDAIVEVLSLSSKSKRAPLSVWVPGCATGEDAYSIALLADAAGLEVQVTASDISRKSLERGREANYGPFSLREVPAPFFAELEPTGKVRQVSDRIRSMVRFVEHNLMDPPLRAPGGWDVVLCRNVFIYFSQQNASRCAEALSKVLNPDGTLFWGAGELMTQTPVGIYPVSIRERIAFRRIQTGVQPKGESSKPVRPLTAPTHLASPLVWGEQSPQKHPRGAPASTDWEELLAREDIASATQEVLRLSAEMPLDPTLRTAAGVFLYSSGDYDWALREFRASLVLDSRLWFAALYEGLCLDGLGRREEALACYQAAERSLVSTNNSVALPEALKGHGAELRDMLKAKTRTANSS